MPASFPLNNCVLQSDNNTALWVTVNTCKGLLCTFLPPLLYLILFDNSFFLSSPPFPFAATCSIQECQNGGVCASTTLGYQCICPSMFYSTFCETAATNPCGPAPCQNGGNCPQRVCPKWIPVRVPNRLCWHQLRDLLPLQWPRSFCVWILHLQQRVHRTQLRHPALH